MAEGYQFIDIGAKGEGIVVAAFDNQVAYCTQAGATVTARVVAALRDLLERGEPGELFDAIRAWPGGGSRSCSAAPIRMALVLTGEFEPGDRIVDPLLPPAVVGDPFPA